MRGPKAGEYASSPESLWSLSSKGHVTSSDLEEHLAWLLDQVAPAKDELARYVRREDVSAYIFVYWASPTGLGGPTLSPAIMARMAEVGLELRFDLYFFDEPEETDRVDNDAEDNQAPGRRRSRTNEPKRNLGKRSGGELAP